MSGSGTAPDALQPDPDLPSDLEVVTLASPERSAPISMDVSEILNLLDCSGKDITPGSACCISRVPDAEEEMLEEGAF